MLKSLHLGAGLGAILFAAGSALANVYITEFSSDAGNGTHLEYVEFTNTGAAPVDMTGWSEDDSHGDAGTHSLAGLGILQPGESGILTQADAAAFRSFWGSQLSASVPIAGPYTNDDLSTTADTIYLFNPSGTVVDRLDYSGTGMTGDEVGRNAPLDALGKNDNALWVNSYIGDVYGSFHAFQNRDVVGDPGQYTILPEPVSLGLLGTCAMMIARRPRKS
jgi:hypothetical protein